MTQYEECTRKVPGDRVTEKAWGTKRVSGRYAVFKTSRTQAFKGQAEPQMSKRKVKSHSNFVRKIKGEW